MNPVELFTVEKAEFHGQHHMLIQFRLRTSQFRKMMRRRRRTSRDQEQLQVDIEIKVKAVKADSDTVR